MERSAVHHDARVLADNFRYHRMIRYPEACVPWVMGQELGWVVCSPLDITLSPVREVQIAAGDDQLQEAGRLLGRSEFWRRGDGFIATERNDWARAYQFRGTEGGWEAMFLPNGAGTVEWRLGWGIRIPADSLLLVTGLDDSPGVRVPTGVMTGRQINRTWDGAGFSLAIEPTAVVTLHKGQPIARLVLLGRDSVQASIEERGDA
ncbi:hypothetical protein [Jatrophihabitans lederbergiae]|uniref:Uncharacterized protein n=1 Tax=Jatrophihabitans lederbergiae TaxID=3075547 RepID=A0ABU2JDS5_9ACTN|nr:hypothetical protein [Jatrophihabitans sp. DSM 44399]MDT0263120.1 hypothetical protein [Jatrophihabitans sp. DSM 44399]